MFSHQQKMRRFGLTEVKLPANVGDVVEKRIQGLWEINWSGNLSLLDDAIKKYDFDCYTQGLMDATSPTVRAGIERMVLEGIVPPMEIE